MWEWLSDAAKVILRGMKFDARIGSADDIVQETMMYLLNKSPEVAEKIYKEHNAGLLYSIVKKVIFTEAAKLNGVKRTTLTYYRTVSEVCDKHGIDKIPENAYKISGILGKPYTIPYVISLIETAHQPDTYYNDDFYIDRDSEE